MTCCIRQRVSNNWEQVPSIPHQRWWEVSTPSYFTVERQTLYRQPFLKPRSKTPHFNLDMDGTWTQNVEFSVKAWHAGNPNWAGYRNLNSHSIGIEVCNPGPLTMLKVVIKHGGANQ